MQLQVLVHPKRVECLGIEACQEHAHHDEDIYLLVLHAERHVFVVRLEVVAVGRVGAAEHLVVVLNGCFQSVSALQIQSFCAFWVLVFEAPFVLFRFIGAVGEDGGDFQVGSAFFCELLLELVVV